CAIGVQLTYLFLDYRSPTLPVFPGLVDVPGCLVQPFPFPFALLRQQGIGQRLVALCFATQFAVALPPLGCQRPVTQRALHRAPRLAGVRAIAVTALFSQTGDLIESLVHGTLARPKLQFAHSRSVDQRTSRGQRDEFAVRSRMASAAVRFAHFRGAQAFL